MASTSMTTETDPWNLRGVRALYSQCPDDNIRVYRIHARPRGGSGPALSGAMRKCGVFQHPGLAGRAGPRLASLGSPVGRLQFKSGMCAIHVTNLAGSDASLLLASIRSGLSGTPQEEPFFQRRVARGHRGINEAERPA